MSQAAGRDRSWKSRISSSLFLSFVTERYDKEIQIMRQPSVISVQFIQTQPGNGCIFKLETSSGLSVCL